MKKLVKDKRPHGRHGQPDEPCPKDPCHDEDDVVTALAWPDDSKRDFWDLDESITGVGGRDVSADDPGLLDDEAAGHLGLDEDGDKKGLYHNVNKRRKAGKAPKKPGEKGYPTDKAWKDSAKTAKESRIQFEESSGIVYSGKVIGTSKRYIFIEMGGNKLSVRKDNPTIKVLEKEKPTYGIPYPCPSATCPDDEDKAAKRARKRLKKRRSE